MQIFTLRGEIFWYSDYDCLFSFHSHVSTHAISVYFQPWDHLRAASANSRTETTREAGIDLKISNFDWYYKLGFIIQVGESFISYLYLGRVVRLKLNPLSFACFATRLWASSCVHSFISTCVTLVAFQPLPYEDMNKCTSSPERVGLIALCV